MTEGRLEMWQSPARAVSRLAIVLFKVIPVEATLPGVLPLPVRVSSVSTTVKSSVTLAVQGKQEISPSRHQKYSSILPVVYLPKPAVADVLET